MEIRFYDADMEFMGIMENQSSLVWTRKYQAAGSFEIRCPITEANLELARHGGLVWVKGFAEAGVIEKASMNVGQGGDELAVGGRFLESYFDRRLVRPKFTALDQPVEGVMRALITNAAPLTPLLEFGDVRGFPEKITMQATYRGLLECLSKLAKQSGMGFRVRPDFERKRMVFETYKGVERAMGQDSNPWVAFSEAYGNISGMSYSRNSQLLKNVCYVGGQGEGPERVFAMSGDGALAGLARREEFFAATDIRPEDFGTTGEYRETLTQRGDSKLEDCREEEAFECQAMPSGSFEYKGDWDLGDVVTVHMEQWGINAAMRIFEVQEAYERGVVIVTPTIGTTLPEAVDWGQL